MMLPDPTCATAKVAFAIGRPVGTAVTRNRIRRRLRDLLRRASLVPGLYLFGVSRDATNEPSFTELATAIDRIAARSASVTS